MLSSNINIDKSKKNKDSKIYKTDICFFCKKCIPYDGPIGTDRWVMARCPLCNWKPPVS